MVMGENSLLAAGPIGAYGPFLSQINNQQATYLYILATGDLNHGKLQKESLVPRIEMSWD